MATGPTIRDGFTPCRTSQHCAVHGFCHRCAPHLAEAARHIVKALPAAGIADVDKGRIYAEIVTVLLGAERAGPNIEAICGDRLLEWVCILPAGPHSYWHHRTAVGNWWTQTRCPNDCGQPNTEHDCAKEASS